MKLATLELPEVAIMGVVNVTPDSFSDGGRYDSVDGALRQALRLVEEGADIVDVGGESTRPGSEAVALSVELDRVIPVIEAIRRETDVPISVDTTKAGVMREAVAAGAGMVNDVRALQDEGALDCAASLDCAICLMHMQGQPRSMQASPQYDDVVREVKAFLAERVAASVGAGIARERLSIDPGFGFGKTLVHNMTLLARLAEFREFDLPVLAGLSRKRSVGEITDRSVDERMPASIVAAAIAVQNGASIVRVHDVAETVDAVRVVRAVASHGDKA